MVCSRYPKECRYYETTLKRKCFTKLRINVWENKTKWILLDKAESHYRMKLLYKSINLWMGYLNECYKKKINRRAAEALQEEKLKSRGLRAFKKNVEHNRTLMRICSHKFEWNLKFKCWHQWKHYAEKRLKVREVKLLANRIREESLRIRFLYLWLFRFNEKQSLQNAYEAAAARHKTKQKKYYFRAWEIFTNKQICKKRIENLADTCYEEKLMERFLRAWKRHTRQKKRYRYQMKIIQSFYENYLLENYLTQWRTAYKGLKLERKTQNLNMALRFYERKLLEKGFRTLQKVREKKREMAEKEEKFRDVYVKLFLNFWKERRKEKMIWNDLERKASKWREDFLLESHLLRLFDEFQRRMEEREEMARAIEYSNSVVVHRAFRGWREMTERKICKKIELENASKFYTEKLARKTLENWKNFLIRKSRKKMAAGYYGFILLSRVMDQWKAFHSERKAKLEEAKKLELKHNARLVKKVFDCWKEEAAIPKSKVYAAITFQNKKRLSKAFSAWKKCTRIKSANKARYCRNKTILSCTIIKNSIVVWYEMLLAKENLKKKLDEFQSEREKRSLKVHCKSWHRLVEKMKSLRQNIEFYPHLREGILIEHYLLLLSEATTCKKDYKRKEQTAKKGEEKLLKRRYLRKWLGFIQWKRERLLECVTEERKLGSKENFEVFIPYEGGGGGRRKPMIPSYLKADFNFVQIEDLKHRKRKITKGQVGEI